MKKTLTLLLAALALSAFSTTAMANKAAVKPANDYPAPIKMAVSGGLKVEKQFEAAGGMTGWILSQGVGQNIVVFTTPDAQVAIAGNMMDAKGQNLTKQYLEDHAPEPDYTELWNALRNTGYAVEGPRSSKNVIYVFKDANCSFCHLAWRALQPYTAAGLQVRWVPVAFLAEDSMGKAAAMMSARDGNAHMKRLHESWGKQDPSVIAKPTAAQEARVQANNKLMNDWGFRGTPATVYKDKNGKVQVVGGMFRLSQLPEITGLPEQPQNDPQLARFK